MASEAGRASDHTARCEAGLMLEAARLFFGECPPFVPDASSGYSGSSPARVGSSGDGGCCADSPRAAAPAAGTLARPGRQDRDLRNPLGLRWLPGNALSTGMPMAAERASGRRPSYPGLVRKRRAPRAPRNVEPPPQPADAPRLESAPDGCPDRELAGRQWPRAVAVRGSVPAGVQNPGRAPRPAVVSWYRLTYTENERADERTRTAGLLITSALSRFHRRFQRFQKALTQTSCTYRTFPDRSQRSLGLLSRLLSNWGRPCS